MKSLSTVLLLLSLTTFSHASLTLSETSEKPAENLAHYLNGLLDEGIDLQCIRSASGFQCLKEDFTVVKTDEENVTARTHFDRLELLFRKEIAPYFEKNRFDAAMREYRRAEKARQTRKRSGRGAAKPVPTPQKDAMDRALWRTLDRMVLKNLRIDVSHPATRTFVKEVVFENRMTNLGGKTVYSDRIFGTLSLRYRDFVLDTNATSDSAYTTMTRRLERWLETNDTKRAEYVAKKLRQLSAKRMKSPTSGKFVLKTRYIGNDSLSLRFLAASRDGIGDRSDFSFDGEVHHLRSMFNPKEKEVQVGAPDFLFLSMHLQTDTNNTTYRHLLAHDRRFHRYIADYDDLIRARYDEKMKRYAKNPVVAGWLKQAKKAFSKVLRGEAKSIVLSVKNRTGATAMQLVGAVIAQLSVMPQKGEKPDREKLILDTAAANLDVRIEAE
ncbi:hypothetical protein [Hydrogenimonas urashimensis]|uniref:hypothetical protein n=1 Tax=Hydrogenimonas urashimensis TaxID=2740515 RepID=UPI001915CA4F|nr:hypothetical protein [Hydrogenimonas urashimensis]